jgi:hypothetical protein
MSSNSKQRVQADAAFLKTQTQTMTRNRIQSESDAEAEARNANTARLKALRLRKEALDQAAADAAPPKSRSRKSAKTT